jgi:hypothetical protein
MEEKVTQMQRQLDQTQKELQAAKDALAARESTLPTTTTTQTAAASSGGVPSRETVEQSYSTSVIAFRKELEANLKDFRVESCTTHSVQMPSEFFPFTSQLSLALVSDDGKNFTTDIPVKADVNGKWIFPTVAEVTQRIASVRHAASTSASSRSSAQKQPAGFETPAPYMKVDGTFVVQWPEAKGATTSAQTPLPVANTPSVAAATVPPSSPPPHPQPSAQPGAQPVMPVNRDVQVQFPSPP